MILTIPGIRSVCNASGLFLIVCFFLLAGCIRCLAQGLEEYELASSRQQEIIAMYNSLDVLGPNRVNFDVIHYDLALSLDFPKRSIEGIMTMTARVVEDLEQIQLELSDLLTIHKIIDLSDSSVRPFTRLNKRSLLIELPPHAKGQLLKLAFHYGGKPRKALQPPWVGGLYWTHRAGKNDISVACEAEGASLWWPVKEHLADEPDSVTTHITVDSGIFVVGNGRLINQKTRNGRTTFTWATSYPINTYNVTFYAGNYEKIEVPYTGKNRQTMMLEYYVMPNHVEKARQHFEQVPGILRIFEGLFGPYPWYKDGFKLVESPYAGMEHQTAIAYGSDYKNDMFDGKMDYILVHEIAHEWWGNSVSCGDMADIWLHEGFATYAEALYMEKRYGPEAYDEYFGWKFFPMFEPYPIVTQELGRYFDFTNRSNVYDGGALVLHTFRNMLNNDSLFFDILFSFCFLNHRGIVSTASFVDHVNQKTQQDYSWFFRTYLLVKGPPVLSYRVTLRKNLVYKWLNVMGEFDKMPVNILVGGVPYTIIPSPKAQKLPLSVRGKLKIPGDLYIGQQVGYWSFD